MAVVTKYLLAEQISRILSGGDIAVATMPSLSEIKVAVGQAINSLLKIDILQMNVNREMDEKIPNAAVIGIYENIAVESYNGKSRSTLPITPLRLPRNMGVWAIYPKWQNDSGIDFDNEFIPLQMGQGGMLKSQALISDLLNQVGYEVFGSHVIYTKDLTQLYPTSKVAMRLVIMDLEQYSDYDTLPIPPEMEANVVKMVVDMYKDRPTPDKLVDSAVKEQVDTPITQQRMN